MTDTLRLRIFMLERGLTHQKIASFLGISKSYVDDILKFRSPSRHIREALKRDLGFPSHLIDYDAALNARLKGNRASKSRRTQLKPRTNPLKASHA